MDIIEVGRNSLDHNWKCSGRIQGLLLWSFIIMGTTSVPKITLSERNISLFVFNDTDWYLRLIILLICHLFYLVNWFLLSTSLTKKKCTMHYERLQKQGDFLINLRLHVTRLCCQLSFLFYFNVVRSLVECNVNFCYVEELACQSV